MKSIQLNWGFLRLALHRRPNTDLYFLFICQTLSVAMVTGTNGKSTVVTLIQQILATGMGDVRLGGNVGTPCLDVLDKQADCYVLEASSYQLELATNFPAEVAVLLNLVPMKVVLQALPMMEKESGNMRPVAS